MNNNFEFNMEIIVNEYSNYVFKIVDNIVGTSLNYQDKEDIVSDVFYLLWKHQDNIQSNLKSYIGTIARNCTYDKLKKIKPVSDYNEETLFELEDSFIEILSMKEKINSLSKTEKELFNLYYVDGYKIKEISKILKLNSNLIKVRLHRLRKKLRGNKL